MRGRYGANGGRNRARRGRYGAEGACIGHRGADTEGGGRCRDRSARNRAGKGAGIGADKVAENISGNRAGRDRYRGEGQVWGRQREAAAVLAFASRGP